MDKLHVLDILENNKEEAKQKMEFLGNIVSKGSLTQNKQLDVLDDEGITLIQDTLQYIENIFNNANRLIVNEEEIVKIELAKKITSDSVKHLAKHTNYIQNIKDNGDVEPAKILNVNKEESYVTYENIFIYSLIQNIKIYLREKKENLNKISRKDKNIEYVASTKIDGKEVTVNYNVNSQYTEEGIKKKVKDEIRKIEELEGKITILTELDLFKLLKQKHVKEMTTPVKKTNLILKNVNFQYAVKLWEYLQGNLGQEIENDESVEQLEEKTLLKKMMDEIFLLQYIAMQKKDNEEKEELSKEIKQNLVKDVLEFANMPNIDLEGILTKKIDGKLENSYIEKQVRKVFNEYFKQYEKILKGK